MKYKCVIFDLDGTLLDTIEDLTVSINYALKQFGFPVHQPQDCLSMIGHGREYFVKSALPEGKLEYAQRMLDIAWSHYYENALIQTRIYPNMLETVEKLLTNGVKLAVLTNKDQKTAQMMTKHYFKDDIFEFVIGAVGDCAPKPEPAEILKLVSRMGFSADTAIMVGDTEADVSVGKNAGIAVTAVSWGFRDKDTLKALEPDYLIDTPDQLLDIVGC